MPLSARRVRRSSGRCVEPVSARRLGGGCSAARISQWRNSLPGPACPTTAPMGWKAPGDSIRRRWKWPCCRYQPANVSGTMASACCACMTAISSGMGGAALARRHSRGTTPARSKKAVKTAWIANSGRGWIQSWVATCANVGAASPASNGWPGVATMTAPSCCSGTKSRPAGIASGRRHSSMSRFPAAASGSNCSRLPSCKSTCRSGWARM